MLSLLPCASASGQVAASSQVFAAVSRSSPESAPCLCCPLSHETLLWHHRLGHPFLPRLRGLASCTLVLGLPRSLPPLPPGPAPTYVPCVEGRERAAPHSSTFPPIKAPLQTLHIDVWGLARVRGQGHERYFLLVVDDYSRYTTVFPLRSKGEVTEVLIDWIRNARRQLSERFGSDLPVLRLHSDRGGEFSSDLMRAFCRAEGIRQTFTLLASPQQNGIAEHRIGMVMVVARTSMIHAAAPHFQWPFAVQYAAHQINLQPRVSLPETTPTLRWTGKVGDASVFRVWGSRAFVRDTSADNLSSRAVPCVFLGFPPDASGWQFYHPTSRRVLSSQDVTFDESVSYYRLFPYRTASPPPLPLFLAPGTPPVDPLPPQGPAPSGVSQVDPAEPVELTVDSSAARGAEPAGAGTGGAEPGVSVSEGAELGGAEPERVEPGGPPGVPSRRETLSPQQLREWYTRRCRGAAGAAGATNAASAGGNAGAAGGVVGTGAAGGASGAAGGTAGVGAAGAAGAGTVTTGVASGAGAAGGTGAGGAAGVVAGNPGAEGTGAVSAVSGGAVRPRPYYVPLLQQVLRLPPSPGPTPPLLSPPPVPSQSLLQPTSPLPGPSPYSGPTRVLTKRREPESRPVSPESRPASPESRSALPVHISTAASALVAELVEFAAACRLDFATSLVAESASASVSPPSIGGECALGMDVLEDRQEEFECFAATVPHLVSMLFAPEGDPDAPDIPTPRSYAEAIEGTYVNEIPPPGENIISGMWIFRGLYFFQTFSPTQKMTTLRVLLHVAAQGDYKLHSLDLSTAFVQGSLHEEIWLRRPPGFTGSFPSGTHSSCEAEIYAGAMAAQELRWLTYLLTDLGEAPRSPPVLRKHIALRYFLARDLQQRGQLRLAYVASQANTANVFTKALKPCDHQPPPSDESVEPSGLCPELVGCLMYLMTCTRPDLAYPLSLLAHYMAPGRHRKVHWDAAKRVLRYLCSTSGMGLMLRGRGLVVLTGHADASWVYDLATQRSSKGYTFTLGSGSTSWQSIRSSSVLSSRCEAEIYAGAMAAQELR
ncbi:unnamed protein product [Closterium sp. NIES-53]